MTFLIAAFLMTLLLAEVLVKIHPPKPAVCSPLLSNIIQDEDGTRIASPSPETKGGRSDLEPSPEEIDLYFKHKQCGNLEKARELGIRLGENILTLDPSAEKIILSTTELSLARMLYLFVTEDCIHKVICDPILLKLILSQINDTITLRLPDFYSNFFQYRSYTIYKMCLTERSNNTSLPQVAEHIGECWARMAGRQQDEQYCRLGAKLYMMMKGHCEHLLFSTSFAPVA